MVGFWCCCSPSQLTFTNDFSVTYIQSNYAAASFLGHSSYSTGTTPITLWDDSTRHVWFTDAITIAQGYSITSAFLEFAYAIQSDTFGYGNPGSASQMVRIRVFGEDNDDKDTSPTTNSAYDALPRTTAYTDFSLDASTHETIQQFEVTNIVQEILNRSGWSSGNKMGFFLEDNGSDAVGTNPFLSNTWFTYADLTGNARLDLIINL